MRTAAHDPRAIEHIEAAADGYREHVRLTEDELERLAGVINMVPLCMACGYYRLSVETGYTPSGLEGWWPNPEHAEQLAAKAIEMFRR